MTTSFLRAAAFALAAAASSLAIGSAHAAADPAAIVKHYAEIAHAKYSDALDAAKATGFFTFNPRGYMPTNLCTQP